MENANIIKDIVSNGYIQLALSLLALYLAVTVFRR